MAYSNVRGTAIGRMRLMIPDRIEAEMIFSDEELQDFLDIESSVLKCGVAAALEAIAIDEALVQKVVKVGAVTTDGAKLADAILARATKLRAQAAADDAGSDEEIDGAFGIASFGFVPFGVPEILRNEALRNG